MGLCTSRLWRTRNVWRLARMRSMILQTSNRNPRPGKSARIDARSLIVASAHFFPFALPLSSSSGCFFVNKKRNVPKREINREIRVDLEAKSNNFVIVTISFDVLQSNVRSSNWIWVNLFAGCSRCYCCPDTRQYLMTKQYVYWNYISARMSNGAASISRSNVAVRRRTTVIIFTKYLNPSRPFQESSRGKS